MYKYFILKKKQRIIATVVIKTMNLEPSDKLEIAEYMTSYHSNWSKVQTLPI